MTNTELGNRKTQVLNGIVLLTEAVKKGETYNIVSRYGYLGTKIELLVRLLEDTRKLTTKELAEISEVYHDHRDTDDLLIVTLLTLLDIENPTLKDLGVVRTLKVYLEQENSRT
jgi:hypothetical protein